MRLYAIHHVQISIPKDSEEEARAFYRDLLGLKEIQKPDSLAGRGGFWLELGSTQIHFGTENSIDRHKTNGHAAYLVDDLESWRRSLTAAGCEVIDGIPIPGYERFEFRDPFGNRVEFLQAYSAVAQ
jgi:Lactoylglutathione lyase and related lyases